MAINLFGDTGVPEEKEPQPVNMSSYMKAMMSLSNPKAIPGLLEGQNYTIPNAAALRNYSDADYLREERYRWYADQFEQAYYQNRGDIPVEWLLQQHVEDLKFFSDPMFSPLMNDVIRNQALARIQQRQDEIDLDKEAEHQYLLAEAAQLAIDEMLDSPPSHFTSPEEEAEYYESRGGDIRVTDIQNARLSNRNYRAEDLERARIILAGGDPDQLDPNATDNWIIKGVGFLGSLAMTQWNTMWHAGAMLVNPQSDWGEEWFAIRAGYVKAAGQVNPATESANIEAILPDRGRYMTKSAEQQELEEQLKQLRTGDLPKELKMEMARNTVPASLIQMMETSDDPEMQKWRQQFIDDYGEDNWVMGFTMEMQDFLLTSPDGEKLIQDQVYNGLIKPKEEQLEYLDETNYLPENGITEAMAWWGEKTTAWASFLVAAGEVAKARAADAEIGWEDTDQVDYWDEVYQTAEDGGWTPSGVLGLDGTAVGMGMDFFGSTVVDPFTWFTGPTAKAGIMGIANKMGVSRAMNSIGTMMGLRSMEKVLTKQDGMALGRASMLNSVGEVGLAGEVMNMVEDVGVVLNRNDWLYTKEGRYAAYRNIDAVESILSPAEVTKLDELVGPPPAGKADTVEGAVPNLIENGFQRPLVVGYDEASGRIWLQDGFKRLAAAKRTDGLTGVPVVIKKFKGHKPLKGYKSDTISRLEAITKDGFQESVGKVAGANEAVRDTILAGLRGRDNAGELVKVRDITLANGDKGTIKVSKRTLQNQHQLQTGETIVREGITVPLGREDIGEFYIIDEYGRGIAAVETGWGSGFGSARDQAGQHLIEQLLDEAHKMDIDLVNTMEFKSLSDAGKAVIDRYANRVLGRWAPGKEPGTLVKNLDVTPNPKARTWAVGKNEYYNPGGLLGEWGQPKTNRPGLKSVVKKAIEMGADIPFARQTWAATGLGMFVRALVDTPFVPSNWIPYLGSTFNVARVNIGSVGGVSRLLEIIQFLGVQDSRWVNHWMQRVLDVERNLGAQRLRVAAMASDLAELRRLKQAVIDKKQASYTWGQMLQDGKITQGDVVRIQNLGDTEAALGGRIINLEDNLRKMVGESDGYQIHVTEMLEDYNREFIATNPQWADLVDPETGMVPWEELHRGTGRSTTPDAYADLDKKLQEKAMDRRRTTIEKSEFDKMTGEDILRVFDNSTHGGHSVDLPATPIELIAATSKGGAAYTKWSQKMLATEIRQVAQMYDAIWKANILMSPRTFGVMSIDEIMSHFHAGGVTAVYDYLEMRIDLARARGNAFVRGDGFSISRGSEKMRPEGVERIRSLRDVPAELRDYQAFLDEAVNRGTTYMERNHLGWRPAADKYTRGHLNDPAFVAYLQGEDAFREWWATGAGEEWRADRAVRFKKDDGTIGSRLFDGWEEGYQAMNLVWKRLEHTALAEGLDDLPKWKQAWIDTANQIAADNSGRAYSLPEWAWDYLGPIPGTRPVYPGSSIAWEGAARIFEAGAATPSNVRQGNMANFMRKKEMARLKSLFQDQGFEVVSSADLMDMLKVRGISPSRLDDVAQRALDLELAKGGKITQSYINRLVEAHAMKYVDDMTYSFEQGSRFGRNAMAIFPFGRPWGEMYARWGRQLASRPVLRPSIANIPGVSAALQMLLDVSPMNPRTMAYISRMANTDLHITRGLFGEQQTDLDFSPLTFLPTAGAGGYSALIPGLGVLPIVGLDFAVERLLDPVEDPSGYQAAIDHISSVAPALGIQGRMPWQRVFGSGITGLLMNSIADIQLGQFHNPSSWTGTFLGNVGSEIRLSRAVSAQFADPHFMEFLLSAKNPDEVMALLLAANHDATEQAAKIGLAENFSRWVLPVRGTFDPNLEELYNVWIDAARANPEFFEGLDISGISDDQFGMDAALLKDTGDTIRRQFFELDAFDRDMLIALNPTLAVNLVSTWEWDEDAPRDLPDRDIPYQVGRSTVDSSLNESLDRHNVYIQRGWVVPRDPLLRGMEIIGKAITAKQNVIRSIYEQAAQNMNDMTWDYVVSPETKAMLSGLLTEPVFKKLKITDPRELWENWSTRREEFLDDLRDSLGFEPASPEEAALREDIAEMIRVPEAEEAWSTTWQGFDPENFSTRTRTQPIILTPELEEAAQKLGLDVEDMMMGDDFVDQLLDTFSTTTGAAWNSVKYSWDKYQTDKGRPYALAQSTLLELTGNYHLDPEWRGQVSDFQDYADRMAEKNYVKGLTQAEQQEIVDMFNRLEATGKDAPVNWDKVWRDGFQEAFGPRDWEPPIPPELYNENGLVNKNAWQPFVRSVIDGDTLYVTDHVGPKHLGNLSIAPPGAGFQPQVHKVRLLGINAPEMGSEEGIAAQRRLDQALQQAFKDGVTIWLVRDPAYAGTNTDPYGRELAWLFIGDQPYYFPDELQRGD